MDERELPAGWESCQLGDVIEYGKTIKAEPETISDEAWVLELEDIEKETSRLLQRLVFSDRKSKSTKNTFSAGDVLYGKLRPYLNKVLLADAPGYCSTEIIPLSPGEHLSSRYLFHWLKSPEFLGYTSEVSHGINMPRLGTEAGLKAPLVLAPLNEQRRIAAKLDTTLAAVQSCRQRLEGVADLLKRFRQAVLEAATTGELTREWRNGKEMTAQEVTIQELCKDRKNSLCIGPFGSNLKVSDYAASGVPLIFVREVRTRSFGGLGTKFVSPQKAEELAAHVAHPGDLLMTKMGDPPGDTAVYPSHMPDAVITSDVVCMRPDTSKICILFLSYLLESPSGRDRISEITAGVAQQKISLERFRIMSLPVPPLKEQREIVRRAQALFSIADQLEAKLTAARQVVERLTPALLAKAFRGELVPQDPSEEPASVLLERIRAARQAEAAAGQPSRRSRKKAAANPAPGVSDAAPVPPDLLVGLLRECGALSERALLAASELAPERFQRQLAIEMDAGQIREDMEEGERVLVLVG
jgi:type I restriction enzyme S subunit